MHSSSLPSAVSANRDGSCYFGFLNKNEQRHGVGIYSDHAGGHLYQGNNFRSSSHVFPAMFH